MSGKSATAVETINRDDVNTVVTMREAIASSGLSFEDATIVVNPYKVLNKDKDPLIGKAFFVRKVVFTHDKESGAEYSVTYLVTQDDELYVMTDGSTGIYRQLSKIVADYDRDHSFFFPNGLRKSDYIAENGQPATTYYLA